MFTRFALVFPAILVVQLPQARGDKLLLKDGRTVSGQVSIETGEAGRICTIVTAEGQTLSFDRDDVKRIVYESQLTDFDVLIKFEKWQELVTPVLELPEPSQREFLHEWTDYRSNVSGTNTSEHWGHTRDTLWRTPVDSDEFIDEWSRYAAEFKAVAKSLDYEDLTSKRRRSGSLMEYAMYPPEGREAVAEAVKEALESFERIVDTVESAEALLRDIPRSQLQEAKSIDRARAAAERERSRRSTLSDATRRAAEDRDFARRAAAKDSAVFERIMNLGSTLGTKIQTADERVNVVAQKRVLAVTHAETAAKRIDDLGARETHFAKQRAAGPRQPSSLPISDMNKQCQEILEQHRARAGGLTTVGLKSLREQTRGDIERLYAGKQFSMLLEVVDILEVVPKGYTLIGLHAAGSKDEAVRKMELHFGGEVGPELVYCKRGSMVQVEAHIGKASLEPDLEVVEQSGRNPEIHVAGDVLDVIAGCR